MCTAVKHHERNIKLVFFPVDLLLESSSLDQEPIGVFLLPQLFLFDLSSLKSRAIHRHIIALSNTSMYSHVYVNINM